MARFLSQNDIDEFKECFHLFTKNRGYVANADELAIVMRSLGFSPTIKELETYFNKNHKDGKLDFATFLDVMHVHSKRENCQEEILNAFKAHDWQGKGYVLASDFKAKMTQAGEKLTSREVDKMLKEGNIPPNGKINYNQFVKMMLSPLPDY